MNGPEDMLKATETLAETMKRMTSAPFGGMLSSWRRFTASAHADGELARKHKELIAIAIALVKGCERCVSYHVRSAIEAGATDNEMKEAAFVAVIMDGGPALAHMSALLDAIDAHRGEDV